MTKTVEIRISACAEGVTTAVWVDGELVSNRPVVPTEGGCTDLKPGDIFSDMEEYPELAEVLDDRLCFLDTDLLNWFLDEEDD